MAIRGCLTGLLAFVVLITPYYVSMHSSAHWAAPIELILGWSPYVAAFLSGLVLSFATPSRPLATGAVLGAMISLVIATMNYIGPSIGIPTDFPGVRGSLFVAAFALPFMVFLVLAGVGSNEVWRR